MHYYPVYLDIENRPCLVVGGGGVGARKVQGLLDSGAVVTVVSPRIAPALEKLANGRHITWWARNYRSEDLDGMFLVFGATDDESLNRRIHADATDRNMLCNIADRPAVCNFILPSVVRRGDLAIAVSTGGKSPAFAKALRKDLEQRFGPEYAPFLTLMGAVRERLLAQGKAPEAHRHLFEALIDRQLPQMIAAEDRAGVTAALRAVLGPDFPLEGLLG